VEWKNYYWVITQLNGCTIGDETIIINSWKSILKIYISHFERHETCKQRRRKRIGLELHIYSPKQHPQIYTARLSKYVLRHFSVLQ